MPIVNVLVQPTSVMEEREKLNDMPVGTGYGRQHQPVDAHPRPVRDDVIPVPVDCELGAQIAQ